MKNRLITMINTIDRIKVSKLISDEIFLARFQEIRSRKITKLVFENQLLIYQELNFCLSTEIGREMDVHRKEIMSFEKLVICLIFEMRIIN